MPNGKYNGLLKITGLVITLIVLIIGGGIAYGELKTKVDSNTTTLQKVETRQEKKADKEDVEEIKEDVKEIQKDIKEILRRLPSN